MLDQQRTADSLLDAVFHGAGVALCLLDSSTRILRANAAWLRLARLTEAEALDRTITDLFPGYAPTLLDVLRRVQQGETVALPFTRVASAPEAWWETTAAPVPLPGGAGMLLSARDVTSTVLLEREQELLRNLTRRAADLGFLESVLRQLPAGVLIAEAPSGRLLLGNPQVEQILRQPLRLASSITEYRQYPGFHPDGRPYAPEEWPLARSLRTGETIANEEITLLRGDGSRGAVQASSAPVRDAAGSIVAAVMALVDITEHSDAERTLAALLDEAQAARTQAEEAHQRLRLLIQASALLDESLDYTATLRNVARLATPLLADWCAIDVLEEDGSLRRLAVAHHDPDRRRVAQEAGQRFPSSVHASIGVGEVLRTGRSVVVAEVSDAMLERTAHDSEHLQMLRSLGIGSAILAPLAARGRTLGVLSLATEGAGRRYGPDDLLLAESLANRAALAIDNARLFREARTAQERAAFLSEASAALGRSLDYEVTLKQAAQLATPFLADWCAIHIVEDDGRARPLAVAHSDPDKVRWAAELQQQYPFDPEAQQGVAQVLRTGKSELYPEITEAVLAAAARNAGHLEIMRLVGFISAIIVPMQARGRILGAITLVSAESGRRYTEKDRELAEELADRAALAVDNARLYRQAQEALHARDGFVASAAHDLKNPLTAVKGMAQILRRRLETGGADPARLLQAVGNIDAIAGRMTAQINELMDITRLDLGQPLTLDLRSTDLADLLRRAAAAHQQSVERGRIRVILEVPELIGLWDGMRLERVLDNLLSNALKYSPEDSEITVTLDVIAGDGEQQAVLTVQDRGAGIPAADLPRIFERFRRGSNVGQIAGTGLGLAGSRAIVEQHGGSIAIESREGDGTTVTVLLPVRREG